MTSQFARPERSKPQGIHERLKKLRDVLSEEYIPVKSEQYTEGWNDARKHFVERIDSILRNYPSSGGR